MPTVVANDQVLILGALIGDGSFFVTTKNATYIPEPPLGRSRTVILRTDHLYGADDPIQWPQFSDGQNIHMHCIPARPLESQPNHPQYLDKIMWKRDILSEDSLRFINSSLVKGLAVLGGTLLEELQISVSRIMRHMEEPACRSVLDVPERRQYSDRLLAIIQESMQILRRVPSSPSHLHRRLIELQRAWLYLQGWLNYLLIYRHRIRGREGPASQVDNVIGFFTYDPDLLATAKRAGIPAWLVQPTSSFTIQKIQAVAKPLSIKETLELSLPDPPIPHVYCGQNGSSQHIAAMYSASRCFFAGEIEDISFDPQPPSHPSSNSLSADRPSSSGPVRTVKTKPSARPSQRGSKPKKDEQENKQRKTLSTSQAFVII